MKRYKPTFLHDCYAIEMREALDGQWYSRAELIAAGVLVPVKDENDFATPVRLVKLEDLG